MIDLKQKIEKEIRSAEKQIKQAAMERDESATSMESQHDQTRQIANQLYNSLLEEKKRLVELLGEVAKYHLVYTMLNTVDGSTRKYFIVPNGLGGTEEDGVTLLSEKTPMAKNLLGKVAGSEFEINDQKLRVKKIEENV
ncbi:hypothetical protein A3K29_03550 [Candidatus Collierbacteria bacterium RIFOXYB2_FULL_46_14]|uniref:Transcription elongation factor GreA/GreB C-terminal domain-containing protein n=1 Tax=Candidatus Collierbacteria bacterium GW2011_GWA2_46_26 TaxID=1618381 RepID=A0A0G1PLQ4_9BACT|nr:MAG: hypothetical protein UW29_C0004G0216 [Candidatus Collierbacteria bacterium GW2011_GWC2_44_13]KKU33734.1 MAG: hypothetical protein UX47_C0001G0017 [Candidatus Collierbacteria bacterium GW2011_GWA2_46_26]OGD73193.1 MAG: hypothetical protein A3K29_03550 [Candidatus Collierbacteria bacterium RIFOXYB2_FULL_46_14]OGD76235.1 MAG: hypothetical protein A3K43_03550 [Candidatus Collierbacteria bacterium RIFOXYA2_FULL_46_20]OGD77571.1 MAG: hypothetical protein A3K39_03550 [Candidatus Collierbacteri